MTNRVVDIFIGMQYGSEGKGRLVETLASKYTGAIVRTGSVNAAHTVHYNGRPFAWHQLPAGSLHSLRTTYLVLGAGAQIDMKYLRREIEWLENEDALNFPGSTQPRLVIDPGATIIDEFDVFAENGFAQVCGPQWYNPTACDIHNGDVAMEAQTGVTFSKEKGTCEGCPYYPEESLHRKLGSTTHGSGMNLIRKLARNGSLVRDNAGRVAPPVKTAADMPELEPFLADTVTLLNSLVDMGKSIMLEGTQGAMLSVHHGTWPKCTSRDTNAASWCAEAGISPLAIRNVYGVARTFPIRVAGNSGPTSGRELTWREVSEFAGVPYEHNDDPSKVKGLIEITTATKRVRRVFEFGDDDFAKAVAINRPTELMLTFVDYLDISNYGKLTYDSLSQKTKDWIEGKERQHGVYFRWLSTGPKYEHTIDRGPRQ